MVVADKLFASVVRDLETYLQVKKKIERSGEPVDGISSTALRLVSSSNKRNLLGLGEVENALIFQWLEYASLYISYIDKSKSIAHQVLKELNGILARQTYVVKNNCTIADVVLFYVLWNTVSSLSFQEKEQYISLSRWFNTLQQDDKLRQYKKVICFSRTLLYQ